MSISNPKQTLQNLLDFRAAVSAAPLKLLCLAGALTLTPSFALAQNAPDSYWTQFVPSTDTRLVFVSSSRGNDSNTGLNPNSPVKTLAKGYALLRDAHPDWMLLQRGDVWNESLPRWNKSGRSESEMMIAGAYGDDPARPQIRPEGGSALKTTSPSNETNYVSFVGLHLEPFERSADQASSGIIWLSKSHDILLEDMYIAGFSDNINLQAYYGDIVNFRINGCVIVDAWSMDSHSQGIYASGIDDLTIENSVFDSNGLNHDRGAEPTIFNHNIYLQTSNNNVIVQQNIISNASSHGIHFRSGGLLLRNIFISNPIGIDIGGGTPAREGGVSYDVSQNVVTEGRGITPQMPRGWGISVKNTLQGTISENIIANCDSAMNVFAMRFQDPADGTYGIGFHDLQVTNNAIVNWNGSVIFASPTPDQPYENVSFTGNTIYRDLRTESKPLIDLRESNTLLPRFDGNVYRAIIQSNLPFSYSGNSVSAENWESDHENQMDYQEVSQLPEISIAAYMNSIGLNGGSEEFIQEARLRSRQNDNSQTHALNVYEWMKNALPR